MHLYTVGLLSSGIDPALLSYPIPVLLETYTAQMLFLNSLVCAKRTALAFSFNAAAHL